MSPWLLALLGVVAYLGLSALWIWWERRRALALPAGEEPPR